MTQDALSGRAGREIWWVNIGEKGFGGKLSHEKKKKEGK